MSGVSVAMGEIVRVATWSLRALGYSYGVAERAGKLLAYTEAAVGGGLTMLRVAEAPFIAAALAPAAPRPIGGREIDAAGKCLLETGPPAIDLASADARIRGTGRVLLRNALGTIVVPALCDLAVRRGMGVLAAFGDCPAAADVYGGRGWVAAWPAGVGPVFLRGDTLDPAALRDTPFGARPSAGGEGLQPGDVRLTVVALDPAGRWPAPPARADYPDRVAAAYRGGVMVEAEDLVNLYTVEKRTWAPTSERSRKQAGF